MNIEKYVLIVIKAHSIQMNEYYILKFLKFRIGRYLFNFIIIENVFE